ncbi:MAG: DMT family transporter [Acidiferrobacter sp.]
MTTRTTRPGIASALAAAALFGVSTPLAKLLVGDVAPELLAGLLYLGAGLCLLAWYGWRGLGRGADATSHGPLTRTDIANLVGAITAGGIIGPVLLMEGLTRTGAANASLLLNLEGVLTALLAWIVFRENVDRRIATGMALIVAGGVLVSWKEGAIALGSGSLLIAGACLAWAIDNNLTRGLSARDPIQIAGLKGLVAGLTNTAVALALGARFPHPGIAAAAGAVGALGYGVSLVLFMVALRHLGSARTGAYFSTAPFLGAGVSLLLLHEALAPLFGPAAGLMALGVYLHLTESHSHLHPHEPQTHTHRHTHDAHHQHEHDFPWDGTEPHTHRHTHASLLHSHRHFPDIHHRHRHPNGTDS